MTYGRSNPSTRFSAIELVCRSAMFIPTNLHAEEVAGRVEDLLVHFEGPSVSGESLDAGPCHGAYERGDVREPRFGGGSPPNGNWLPGVAGLLLLVARNHSGERTATAGRTRRFPFNLSADPHSERLHDLGLIRVREHRHLVAALRTGVDDRERTAFWRTNRLQL